MDGATRALDLGSLDVRLAAPEPDGTPTTLKRGGVAVRDLRRKRTVTVRRGKRYLARAPQRR